MNTPTYYSRCFLAALACAAMLAGCAASRDLDKSSASQVKPIDRVRSGIAEFTGALGQTLDSMKPLTEESSFRDRSRRATFAKNLQSTEQRVETLRTDARELRERASEYLTLWSGTVMTVSGDSVAYQTNPMHEKKKAKYDQFVNALISARDIVLPLLDRLKAIEASSDPVIRGESIRQAQIDEALGIQHLNEALTRLDELQALLQTKGE